MTAPTPLTEMCQVEVARNATGPKRTFSQQGLSVRNGDISFCRQSLAISSGPHQCRCWPKSAR